MEDISSVNIYRYNYVKLPKDMSYMNIYDRIIADQDTIWKPNLRLRATCHSGCKSMNLSLKEKGESNKNHGLMRDSVS